MHLNNSDKKTYSYTPEQQCKIIEKFMKMRKTILKQNKNIKGKTMREINKEISQKLGVNYGTLYSWMRSHDYSRMHCCIVLLINLKKNLND